MPPALKWIAGALFATFVVACADMRNGPTAYSDPSALAVLSPTQNSSVHGVAVFVRAGDVAKVDLNITGFKPGSTHGLHVHESGDCTARDASSAGAHFNPGSTEHGGPGSAHRHLGDLGNVVADSKGDILLSFEVGDIAFGNGPDSIVGHGLVVHADRDDLKSQPAGNSGARLACGLITRNSDRLSVAQASST